MRVYLYDRSNNPLIEMAGPLEESSGLTYASAMPGGMTAAGCRVPWPAGVRKPEAKGCCFEVRNGVDSVWWGRVLDVIQSGAGWLDLKAESPWGAAARAKFTSVYQDNGWTANEIMAAALFGNVEDVLVDDTDWTATSLNLGGMTFTDSSVQDVVAEMLRAGDATTAPWSFLVLPPRYAYNPQSYTFSSRMATTADWTGVTTAGANSSVAVDKSRYSRGGSSIKFAYNGLTPTAYVYHTMVATNANVYMAGRFYIDQRPSGTLTMNLMSFNRAAGTEIVRVQITGADVIQAYNTPATATYTATNSQALGERCWHWVLAHVKISATVGQVNIWLDGIQIMNQTGLNTGSTNIGMVRVGQVTGAQASGTMWADEAVMNAGATNVISVTGECPLSAERLPYGKFFKYDVTDYDIILDVSELGPDYEVAESIRDLQNQVDVKYGSGSYTPGATDSDSVEKYGQHRGRDFASLSKQSGATNAGYVRDRVLAQTKDARPLLNQFSLRTPPQAKSGAPYPLPLLRAGLRAKVRQLPELGTFYLGSVVYYRGERGQEERAEVTPWEPPATLVHEVAKRSRRTYA